jgi:hypothetical protein
MKNRSSNNITLIKELPKSADLTQVCIYGLSFLSAGLFLFLPFVNLLHPSPWQRSIGTIHSISALLATIVAAYVGHLAFPMIRGTKKMLPQLRTLIFWSTFLSFLGIISGNWAYMRYRVGIEHGGASAWLKINSPLTHYTLAQYHELSTLFIIPFGIACTWILWRYGDSIVETQNRAVLSATGIALMVLMFLAMGGMVSGLGIAKIHSL